MGALEGCGWGEAAGLGDGKMRRMWEVRGGWVRSGRTTGLLRMWGKGEFGRSLEAADLWVQSTVGLAGEGR